MKLLKPEDFQKGSERVVAITGTSVYALAGGRQSSEEQRQELANPDHAKRKEWETNLHQIFQQLPKNTKIIAVPEGSGLNAARAALDTGLELYLAQDHSKHFIGRIARGTPDDSGKEQPSAEMVMYQDLQKRAAGVLNAVPPPKTFDRDYFANQRPKDEAARAQMIVNLADKLISGNLYNGPEEKAFAAANKELEKHTPATGKAAAALGVWLPPLPSYKREERLTLLLPAQENDIVQMDLARNTTVPGEGSVLALRNIYSENFPRPKQLAQNSTLDAIDTLLNSAEEPVRNVQEIGEKLNHTSITVKVTGEDGGAKSRTFDRINRDLALAIWAKARGDNGRPLDEVLERMNDIVTNHRFMSAPDLGQYAVVQAETATAHEFTQRFNADPTSYALPKEMQIALTGPDGKLDPELVARYGLALQGKFEPSRDDINHADILMKTPVNQLPANLSPRLRATIEDYAGRTSHTAAQMKVTKALSADLQNEPTPNPVEQRRLQQLLRKLHDDQEQLHGATQRELALGLNDADHVHLTVLSTKRLNEKVAGRVPQELLQRTGLSEELLYSGEQRAFVENTLASGRSGGSTVALTLTMLYKPAVNQDNPDTYRRPDNETLNAEVRINNYPAAALPALRAGQVAPEIHEMLYFPNTLSYLANHKDQVRTQALVHRQTMTVKDGDVVTQHQATQTTVRQNIGVAAEQLFALTEEDLNLAKQNNVGIWAVLQGQRNTYTPNPIEIASNLATNPATGQPTETGESRRVVASEDIGPDQLPVKALTVDGKRTLVTAAAGNDKATQHAATELLANIEGLLQSDRNTRQHLIQHTGNMVVAHPTIEHTLDLAAVVDTVRQSRNEDFHATLSQRRERERVVVTKLNERNQLGQKPGGAELTAAKAEMDEMRHIGKALVDLVRLAQKETTNPHLKELLASRRPMEDKLAFVTGLPTQAELAVFHATDLQDAKTLQTIAGEVRQRSEGVDIEKNAKKIADILFQPAVTKATQTLLTYQGNGANAPALKAAEVVLAQARRPLDHFNDSWKQQANAMRLLHEGTINPNLDWSSRNTTELINRSVYQETIRLTPELAHNGAQYNPVPTSELLAMLTAENRPAGKTVIESLVRHNTHRQAERVAVSETVGYLLKEVNEGNHELTIAVAEQLAQTRPDQLTTRSGIRLHTGSAGTFILNGMNRIIAQSADGKLRQPTRNVTESEQWGRRLLGALDLNNAGSPMLDSNTRNRSQLLGHTDVDVEKPAGLTPAFETADLKPNQVSVTTSNAHPSHSVSAQLERAKNVTAWTGDIAKVDDRTNRRTLTLVDGRHIVGYKDTLPFQVGEKIELRGVVLRDQLYVGQDVGLTLGSSLKDLARGTPHLYADFRPKENVQVQHPPEPEARVR